MPLTMRLIVASLTLKASASSFCFQFPDSYSCRIFWTSRASSFLLLSVLRRSSLFSASRSRTYVIISRRVIFSSDTFGIINHLHIHVHERRQRDDAELSVVLLQRDGRRTNLKALNFLHHRLGQILQSNRDPIHQL